MPLAHPAGYFETIGAKPRSFLGRFSAFATVPGAAAAIVPIELQNPAGSGRFLLLERIQALIVATAGVAQPTSTITLQARTANHAGGGALTVSPHNGTDFGAAVGVPSGGVGATPGGAFVSGFKTFPIGSILVASVETEPVPAGALDFRAESIWIPPNDRRTLNGGAALVATTTLYTAIVWSEWA